MNTSETIGHLAKALAAAQLELTNPTLNKINPHFKSKYADLASVLNSVRPVLGKHGIAIMQITETLDAAIILHTRLVHTSGEWISSTYPVSHIGKHQEMGAALTYAKRQALSAMVGVAGEEDDDGNEATKQTLQPATFTKPVKKSNANEYGPEESAVVHDQMITELMDCNSKEDLRAWATKNAPLKANLIEDHKKSIDKAFQDAQVDLVKKKEKEVVANATKAEDVI